MGNLGFLDTGEKEVISFEKKYTAAPRAKASAHAQFLSSCPPNCGVRRCFLGILGAALRVQGPPSLGAAILVPYQPHAKTGAGLLASGPPNCGVRKCFLGILCAALRVQAPPSLVAAILVPYQPRAGCAARLSRRQRCLVERLAWEIS